jgi:hypothetical protein
MLFFKNFKTNRMNKIIFFAITALSFTGFTAFKAAPPAVITDTHVDICGPFNDFNDCTGEVVTTTGCYNVDVHTVVNGNRATFSLHAQGNLDGSGPSGTEYVVHLNQNQHQNISLVNGQANATLVFNVDFISKGGGPNLHQTVTLHISINANGDVTVTREVDELICNG